MSIFSRRKRTRRLVSLATLAVATSLCSSQVALCLYLKVEVESFAFDGKKKMLYIYCQDVNNKYEHMFNIEMTIGEYKCHFTSNQGDFDLKRGNLSCFKCNKQIVLDAFLRQQLDELIEIKMGKPNDRYVDDRYVSGNNRCRDRRKELLEKSLKETWETQFFIDKLAFYIKMYVDKDYIEINANGDSNKWKEDLRKTMLGSKSIQRKLELRGYFSSVEFIGNGTKKVYIKKQGDKFIIEIKPIK